MPTRIVSVYQKTSKKCGSCITHIVAWPVVVYLVFCFNNIESAGEQAIQIRNKHGSLKQPGASCSHAFKRKRASTSNTS